MCLTVSSVSVGGIRQLIVQIHIIDTTLTRHWIAGQGRKIMRNVMCKSNLSMGENILRRVLMIPCAVFLREQLRSSRSIVMLGIGRGVVYGIGDTL